MKKFLLLIAVIALVKADLRAQYPDLPGNGLPYNVQTLTSGSYVIAMDNALQPGSGNIFNLRAYGLAVRLLDNNKRLKWVIKPGKAKDGIDFSVNAQLMTTAANTVTTAFSRNMTVAAGSTSATVTSAVGIVVGMSISGDNNIAPNTYVQAISGLNVTLSTAALGAISNKSVDFEIVTHPVTVVSFGATSLRDFKSGPFVCQTADTSGIAALVAGFNAEGFAVKVYRTTADVSVDIRYDYYRNGVVWKPKTAILDDGGNANIHESYMENADVDAHNGFVNWTEELTPAFVTGCYTFATEPHNSSAPVAVIQGIRTFVENGGNFLAECAAVRTYELSAFARFQSTNGFDNANENKNLIGPTFSNTDLSYLQINGDFDDSEGGSLVTWRVPSIANGNPPTNNFHYFYSGMAASPADRYTNTSVSKLLTSTSLGGMVFYLGSHSYAGTSDVNINGQRTYLNAMMTPTDPQGSLNTSAVIQCARWPNPVTVNTANTAGPLGAYPLTFRLYEDIAPAGFGPEDILHGNTVTYTAPNTAVGGITVITGPALLNTSKNFLVRITPASGCLQDKFITSPCSTLPVDMISFTAKRTSSSSVNLKWTTASEQNNRGFYVERMIGSSNNWENTGFVTSQAQNGFSASAIDYTFNDANASKGVTQYRLRQVDFDDKSKYSEIRSVKGIDQKGSIIVYPNPSNDGRINVVFDEANVIRDISVLDMSGRTIKLMKGISNNNVQIDNLGAGVYTLRIVVPATGEQTIEKFVVNKR